MRLERNQNSHGAEACGVERVLLSACGHGALHEGWGWMGGGDAGHTTAGASDTQLEWTETHSD